MYNTLHSAAVETTSPSCVATAPSPLAEFLPTTSSADGVCDRESERTIPSSSELCEFSNGACSSSEAGCGVGGAGDIRASKG